MMTSSLMLRGPRGPGRRRSASPTKVRHVAYWRQQFAGRPIRSLTTEVIMDVLPTHVAGKGGKKLTPATRNRYLPTIGRMLNQCAEWGVAGLCP